MSNWSSAMGIDAGIRAIVEDMGKAPEFGDLLNVDGVQQAMFENQTRICANTHTEHRTHFLAARLFCARAWCQPAIIGTMDAVILPVSGCDTNASVRADI